jgi:Na+/melibiose symporter-like transporter
MRLAAYWRGSELPYALAHAGKTMFWTASDLYFAFYLTQVCGIPALTMGLLLAGSYLVNAAADLLLGRQLAVMVRSARSAARAQAVGAVLCSATLALFGLAALAPATFRVSVCLAALLAFRLSYSLYDIPQNSLLALASEDERVRARLAAMRLFVGGIARVTLTASFVPLFVRRTIDAQIGAFLLLVSIMAVLGVASAFALAVRMRGIVACPTREIVEDSHAVKSPIGLHLMMLILSFGTTMFTQLEPYFAAFALPSREQGTALLTAVAVGTSLSQPVWMIVDRCLARPRVAWIALLSTAACSLAFLALALRAGALLPIAGLGYGAGVGGLFFLLWSGVARQAARMHNMRGATATLGAFSGSAKLGQALAMVAIGVSLHRRHLDAPELIGPHLAPMMTGAVLAALVMLALLLTIDKELLARVAPR